MPFAAETKREVWLALRPDGEPGHGTAADPYDVSSPTLFADRVASFQEKTLIHIGPGIFQVPAIHAGQANAPWRPKSGQRILGAGMFVTTLKVVSATEPAFLNRAYFTRAGVYHDSWNTKDVLVRREYYYGVEAGVYHLLGRFTVWACHSLTHAGTAAIFTTQHNGAPFPHTLEPGQAIIVSGASDPLYNGVFSIQSVPTPNTLTYQMEDEPSGPSTGSPQLLSPFQVGSLWAVRNIIDLTLLPLTRGAAPHGINLYGGEQASPHLFREVLLLRNGVRTRDGVADPTTFLRGVGTTSTGSALVAGNLIDLATALPMTYRAGTARFLYNHSLSGRSLQGFRWIAITPVEIGQYVNDPSADAGLVLLCAT